MTSIVSIICSRSLFPIGFSLTVSFLLEESPLDPSIEDQLYSTPFILQTVISLADLYRSASVVNDLRAKYLHEHPDTCPFLLVVNITYFDESTPGMKKANKLIISVREIFGGLPMGTADLVEILKDVMRGRKVYFTVTTVMGSKELTLLKYVPLVN